LSTLLEILGWLGAAVLLLAYGLISFGRVRNRSPGYQALNIVGGALLAANTAWHHAWPSALVNVIWIVIAVGALCTAATSGPATPQGR
jgi:hypothetical protein